MPATNKLPLRDSGKGNWTLVQRKAVLAGYKPISDYGLIGDLKTSALVGIDGSIDWLCLPRFDSASVFCALLDHRQGGKFYLMPKADTFHANQHYERLTNILVTEFKTGAGLVAITDFMPCFKVAGIMISSGEIHRRVECLQGQMELEVFFQPRFNYGAVIPKLERIEKLGYNFFSRSGNLRQELALITPSELNWKDQMGALQGFFTLKKGQRRDFVLRYGGVKPHRHGGLYTEKKLRQTREFWEAWASSCKYEGKYREEIIRSVLALKLLVYYPTGAILAAATTSLPEELGGVRNWDYRFSWIRDSSFVLWALHSLGFSSEAQSYADWLTSIFYLTGGNLQVVLGISGERDISEGELRHLEGYKGSRPVRVGNAAWQQFQLDVYGILLDAMYFTHKHAGGLDVRIYDDLIRQIMLVLERDWKKPDCGIWEVRGESEHFVYSKMWCWVAADRAAKIAAALHRIEDAGNWNKLRDRIKQEIMERGWNEALKTFVRSYGSSELDAANLLMPQVRFIAYDDPKMLATLEATLQKLSHGPFVYRYLAADGLPGKEGAFLICSFWLVKCLAQSGRIRQAQEIMDALVKLANRLGLFSEEVEPRSGAMLGNFPQAFTHMGFITAATALAEATRGNKKRRIKSPQNS